MSAFCDKTFPSLRQTFKTVGKNDAIEVRVIPQITGSDMAQSYRNAFEVINGQLLKTSYQIIKPHK